MKEPRFVIEKSKVFAQLETLKKIFDEVSYSWKTNPEIGRILNEKESCHVSIHGLNELKRVGKKGKIWYFPFAADEAELREIMMKHGLKNFVIDNEKDLEKLTGFASENGLKINVLLRMRLKENTIFTGKHHVFGMRTDEVKKLVKRLAENDGVEKLGVHFHRKTQNVSEWDLKDEVEQSLGEECLEKINVINVGGGLPGKYENSGDGELNSIFQKIMELKKYADRFGIKLMAEPGRFIASSPVRLECYVTAVIENTCFVNASVFGGMSDTVMANVKLIVKEEAKEGKPFTIKGCTPDSADVLRYRVMLKNPQVGDRITFLNCGAYNYATDFCNLPRTRTEITD